MSSGRPMKIVTIVGARPQFVKAAAVSRILRTQHTEILVHTGQHYDDNMSAVFFEELGIPSPDFNLEVGSGPHGAQTGAMLARVEAILLNDRPDWVLLYGDTNSTIAGALAAAKLNIPVAHVEAGLRSFNRAMPEELNRIVTDHLANLLLCPSQTAVQNLASEGIVKGVHLVGDVMFESLIFAAGRAHACSRILQELHLREHSYLLATVHRAENTDSPERLPQILSAFEELEETIIFPVHPRTRKAVDALSYHFPGNVRAIDPVGYLDMVALEQSARMILTDSGGIQKEAYWLGVPCVTMRDQTEWVETVEVGWNVVVGANRSLLVSTVRNFTLPSTRPSLYGDGQSGVHCVALLQDTLQQLG